MILIKKDEGWIVNCKKKKISLTTKHSSLKKIKIHFDTQLVKRVKVKSPKGACKDKAVMIKLVCETLWFNWKTMPNAQKKLCMYFFS